jgi:hypothetical protein
LPAASQGGNEHEKAVFAIQAQRAGTKNQPSPEGLGTMGRRSSAGGAAPHSSFVHPEWLTCLRQVKDGMNEERAEVLVWIGLRRRK